MTFPGRDTETNAFGNEISGNDRSFQSSIPHLSAQRISFRKHYVESFQKTQGGLSFHISA
jgi:hypothetical protein